MDNLESQTCETRARARARDRVFDPCSHYKHYEYYEYDE